MIRKYEGKRGVRWYVTVYAGKGKRAHGGAFATQKAARRAEAALLIAQRSESASDPLDLRLERHFQDLEKTIGRRTLAGYRSIAKNYLIPYFKARPIGSVTTADLETYYTTLKLSPTSIYQHHAILSRFYKNLRRKGVCGDPTEGAVWGRKVRYTPRVLDMEQLKTLLSDYEGHWLYLPVLIAATAGLRRGEICGLRWEDYTGGVLVVRRSLGESQGLFEKATKNERVRAVPLSSLTRAALDAKRVEQEGYCARLGEPLGYICCRKDLRPLRPSTISDSFSHNRYGVRFHDLRHSHATIMALSGESPEAVRARLGHSSVAITLDLYTHLAGSAWDSVDRWDAQWNLA